MPRYKMMVFSDPTEGREEDYNDWYQNIHLKDLVNIDGVQSARRFRFARNMMKGDAHSYLAIYEIETDNIDGVLAELGRAAGEGRIRMSDVIDTEGTSALVYEEFGPVVTAP